MPYGISAYIGSDKGFWQRPNVFYDFNEIKYHIGISAASVENTYCQIRLIPVQHFF